MNVLTSPADGSKLELTAGFSANESEYAFLHLSAKLDEARVEAASSAGIHSVARYRGAIMDTYYEALITPKEALQLLEEYCSIVPSELAETMAFRKELICAIERQEDTISSELALGTCKGEYRTGLGIAQDKLRVLRSSAHACPYVQFDVQRECATCFAHKDAPCDVADCPALEERE